MQQYSRLSSQRCCWGLNHRSRPTARATAASAFIQLRASSTSSWNVGDHVEINNPNNPNNQHRQSPSQRGRILEHTGRGWFRVQFVSDNTTRRIRSSQLRPFVTTSSSSSSSTETHTTPPPPTMIDLDAQVQALRNQQHPSLSSSSSLDQRHLHYLRQVENHMSYTKWVVFTDLHCAPSTLDTCLQVLHVVHTVAVERQAGVAFLGDFWHHRGTLRVDCLNAILQAFQSYWTVPMVLIPGNHDQATLSGQVHSLTPLENAYRVVANNNNSNTTTTFPGPLIFSHPTKFLNALFVPHIRDVATMESVLQSPMAQHPESCQALLVHADVTGACMNDFMTSSGGVPPSSFPPNKYIYSGHFHKPHLVVSQATAAGGGGGRRCIEYLGSPYEVSLAEAQQTKALVVLDASQGWKCVERIPLVPPKYHLGRKHFRISSVPDFMALQVYNNNTTNNNDTATAAATIGTVENKDNDNGNNVVVVRPGDRVVLSVDRREMMLARSDTTTSTSTATSSSSSRNNILTQATMLRKSGVMVEIREVVNHATVNSNNNNDATASGSGGGTNFLCDFQELTPESTLQTFLQMEVDRGVMSNETAQTLLKAGLEILENELLFVESSLSSDNNNNNNENSNISKRQQEGGGEGGVLASRGAELVLTQVTVEGFGPFQGRVTYPLADRGLVLLRGINKDGGSDSNGSGKSSLAMAALWCLTGSLDNRPSQDFKVADVVNDRSKTARVTVHGLWNGEEFSVTRTKTATKSGLIFRLNDADLTTQSAKETQALLEERLGINRQLLARTVFQGQHTSINGLLEATDSELKDQLSLVVPLSMWQSAASAARKKAAEAKKMASELKGMLSIRSSDRDKAQAVLQRTLDEFAALKQSSQENRLQLEEELNRRLVSSVVTEQAANETLSLLEERVQEVVHLVESLENERLSRLNNHSLAIQPIEQKLKEQKEALLSLDVVYESLVRDQIQWAAKVSNAEDGVRRIERTWNLDLLSSGVVPESVALPDVCPTCHQPLGSISSTTNLTVLGEQSTDIASKISGHHHHQYAHDNFEALQESIRDEALTLLEDLLHAREKLHDVEKQLDSCQSVRQAAGEALALIQSQLDQEVSTWQSTSSDLEAQLLAARHTKEQAVNKLAQYAKRVDESARLAELQQELNRIEESWESSQAAVKKAQEECSYYESVVEDLQSQRDQQLQVASTMSDLTDMLGPRGGVQTLLLQNAVNLLQALTQEYLDDLSDGSLRLQFSLDHPGDLRILRKALVRYQDDDIDGDTAAIINGNGVYDSYSSYRERPLAGLSGGQWRRCSLALTFGFADLVSRSSSQHLRSNVLFLDEPLTHLDRSGRAEVGKLLRRLLPTGGSSSSSSSHLQLSTIILILQDLAAEELEEAFDCIDVVVKENGSSSVHVNQSS